MDYAAVGVKQLNLASENSHVDKQSPPDEIRV